MSQVAGSLCEAATVLLSNGQFVDGGGAEKLKLMRKSRFMNPSFNSR